ncbi:LytR/AlgR family response regulator transcription factor [Photobacterium atrarenae]|uniref:LytTR family transcriptional regulator n=1 Tax=Photobacterium atrarenae TaxID=865757 RepID=A0ABY5GJR8_9GAMM|nr:LytTR family DNA-binding domain-containing protein [Photobacterium atrarenae]UTV28812.1 LytTR family transcriptional regulator [Photobacterium atrarenae]
MSEILKGIKHFFSIPLLYQMGFTTRAKCYWFLISTAILLVLFVHLVVHVELTIVELILHVFFTITPVAAICLLCELAGRLIYKTEIWPCKIRVYQFLLLATMVIITSEYLFDYLFTIFEVYNHIKSKHTNFGYDFKSSHLTFILVSAVMFIFIQFVLRVNWSSILNYQKQNSSMQLQAVEENNCNVDSCNQAAGSSFSDLNQNVLKLKVRGEQISVPCHSIVYIRVEENYCHIWQQTSSEEYERLTVRKTLSKLTEQLSPCEFKKVHRSFVVNLQYIDSVSKESSRYYITLKNGDSVPISIRYLEDVRKVVEKWQVA